MDPTTCWYWKRIIPFSIYNIIGWTIFVICEILPLLPPQGFFCKDPKLTFKHQKSTVGDLSLILGGFGIPFIVVMVVEQITVPIRSSSKTRYEKVNQALFWYMNNLSGVAIMEATVNIIKVLYSEPRPHFFDTCKPKEADNCTADTFIYKFTCTGESSQKNMDASFSFPSGHGAVSFYLFLYLAWYCQRKLKVVCSLTLLCIQTMLFLLACFVAISRITDHRHHWWDVLSGAAIGCVFAVYSALMLSKNFNWLEMCGPPCEIKVVQPEVSLVQQPTKKNFSERLPFSAITSIQ